MSMDKSLKVLISPLALTKINYWVQVSTVEISGLGKCKYDANKHAYVVSDAWLLEQENGPTTTDIEATAAAKLLYETRETEGDLNFWWHSHVNMGVYWSGTDTDTIKEFGDNGYCLATVFNKKNEMRSAFYQGANGFLPAVFLDKLETDTFYSIDEAVLIECQSEFELKCRTKTYKQPKFKSQIPNHLYTGKHIAKKSNDYDFSNYYDEYDEYAQEYVGLLPADENEENSIYLGFDFNGSTAHLEQIISGTKSYANYPHYNPLTDVERRGHGDLNPFSHLLWDEVTETWKGYPKFIADNKDEHAPTYMSMAPFTIRDWSDICRLYKKILLNDAVGIEDINDFVTDFMDLSWGEIWEVGTDHNNENFYADYKLELNRLNILHNYDKKVTK